MSLNLKLRILVINMFNKYRIEALLKNKLAKVCDAIMCTNKAKNADTAVAMARIFNTAGVQKNKPEWLSYFVTIPKPVVSLFMVLVFLTNCNSNKKTIQSEIIEIKPTWVDHKPINPEYYYGVGKADKKYHNSDYQQSAKKMALEDLSSEIEVKLDAKSVLYQKENSREYYESYQSTIQIEVTQNISGFEPVDSWNNENEYWVLYRLSKTKYAHIEAEKRNKAISKALHYVDEAELSSEIKKKIDNLTLALQSIKPYLNKPLKTTHHNSTIYLGDYISDQIEEKLMGLVIYPSREKIDLNLRNCYQSTSNWSLQYKNLPVTNFPIRIKFKTYSAQLTYTDDNGLFNYHLVSRYFDNPPPNLQVWINTSDLIDDQLILTLFDEKYAGKRIDITLHKPGFLIDSKKGKDAIQQKIIKSGGKITNNIEQADIILKFNFNITDLGKADDFYITKCEIIVSVIGNNNQINGQKSWPSVKGIHLNKASSREKAIENSLEQIDYPWFQELISDFCNQ